MSWILYDWKHSFDFKGRATRREFWRFTLTLSLIGLLAAACRGTGLFGALLFTAYLLADLVLLPARVTLTMRRLHDTGHSGKWLLAPFGLMLIFALLTVAASMARGGVPAWVALLIASAALGYLIVGVMLLVFTLTQSDSGDNGYGSPSANPMA